MKTFYETTQQISGKLKLTNAKIRDLDGKSLTFIKDQLKHWAERFNHILKRPPPTESADIQASENILDINCESPSKTEIRKAISSLKCGKSAVPDNKAAEAHKVGISILVDMLSGFLRKMEKERIPSDWKEGYVVKLPKKADLNLRKNYRGLMLLSVPGKVLYHIILDRMKGAVEDILRDNQAKFHHGRSCVNQIATLQITIEQSLEWNSLIYINL
ncbi:hypothetical protein scyTo_0016784 [Scyliorhinus torazame]|uniref:Reverse transcriptase domain-containing protein n=1 Tax=Scyliorhinus torazame TaxID=75743 RepID=A0A401PY91_SCYTO|nr:hypothetical protein [Scyliorhinus torazame]